MKSFVDWCQCNHLQLNARKTKELVVDFQQLKSLPSLVTIQGENIEVVNIRTSIGAYLCDKLGWEVIVLKVCGVVC